MSRACAALLVASLGALAPLACTRTTTPPSDEPALAPGPGKQAFLDHCQMCHGTRYVLDQPRLPRATWAAEVEKMRTAYGAPVSSADAPAIVDYLVSLNGTN